MISRLVRIDFFKGGFLDFSSSVLDSTLLHLPPLIFRCVGECWDRTQDCWDFGIGSLQSDALDTRLGLIHMYKMLHLLQTKCVSMSV
jgi:hypothetical protein